MEMNELRPNAQRANTAIIMIWIVMAADMLALISSFLQYEMLKNIAAGITVSADDIDLNDIREGFIGILYLIVYLISGITFIRWFRRAYYNLHQRVSYLAHSDGWAAGAWFVPIVGLYRPYQIMDELYLETRELFERNDIKPHHSLSAAIVGWWWALWIINGIIGQIIYYINKDAETTQQLLSATTLDIISSLLSIPLAIITVKVIKNYAIVEPQLYEIEENKGEVEEESVTEEENTL